MKLTYTNPDHFYAALPPIPKDQKKQIAQLESAVADLIEALMNELGWDNPGEIIDRVCADECNKIAWRAWALNVARRRK